MLLLQIEPPATVTVLLLPELPMVAPLLATCALSAIVRLLPDPEEPTISELPPKFKTEPALVTITALLLPEEPIVVPPLTLPPSAMVRMLPEEDEPTVKPPDQSESAPVTRPGELLPLRSEERRVGKECRSRWS